MVEKHLNIDLNDPRAASIAEVMKSSTAKRILDVISESTDISEKDISDKLDIPLNTVGYNIKKLLKAGLIEKSNTHFWSTRGKKIATYNLSDKKIVISPKKLITKPIVMLAGVVGILAILVLFMGLNGEGDPSGIDLGIETNEDISLNQFSTLEEFENFIEENAGEESVYSGRGFFDGAVEEAAVAMSADSDSSGSGSSVKSSASDVSSTNVQVLGIDEPDFVKNDDEFIYVVSGASLYIIDAYPAEDMKILSNTSLNSSTTNMIVDGDKLVIMSYYYEQEEEVEKGGRITEIALDMIAPRYYNPPKTQVLVFDISSKDSPEIENEYIFEGSYMNARLKDGHLYVISQKYIGGYGGGPFPMPIVRANGVTSELSLDDISYSDDYRESIAFTFVNAIELDSGDHEEKAFLFGSSGTLYVSSENIYLTSVKYLDWEKREELIISEGILPVLKGEYKDKVEELLEDEDIDSWEKQEKALKVAQDYSLSLEDPTEFVKELEESMEDAQFSASKKYEKTVIHKISYDGLDITYSTSGDVPGHLLNQFSLDEHDGNLRVAVTTGGWRGNSLNHMYVLDEDLKIIGSVEDLAPGERIYSARFMGDRAYMVTFRQVDPLYAIDLSDPKDPELLGYLKITGYSSYLHPYDEDHLIGVGMEGTEEGRITGVKISLFDVSNPDDIIEKSKYEIEGETDWSWSSSDALYDHKAFLFDKERSLLVVPIQYTTNSGGRYGQWNGAYVFDIDTGEISLKGKIDHMKEYIPRYSSAESAPIGETRVTSDGRVFEKVKENSWEMKDAPWFDDGYDYYDRDYKYNDYYIDTQEGGVLYYDWNLNWQRRIQRSLYMDEYLYTVSQGLVRSNLLEDLSFVSEVEISYGRGEDRWYGGWGGIAIAEDVAVSSIAG